MGYEGLIVSEATPFRQMQEFDLKTLMKTNKWIWAVLCALAFTTFTGCIIAPDHDHRGGGPDYYGHDYGEHHDYDHDHYYGHEHDHEWR